MVNKKGQLLPIIILVGGIFLLLVIGFIFSLAYAPIKNTMDELEPIINDLGQWDDVNASYYGNIVYTPVDTLVTNFSWIMGILYILGIIGLLGIAVVFRGSRSGLGLTFFLGLSLLVILCSILISNAYEDYYSGTDDTADVLKEQILMSWLIIYSPMILSLFVFIAGIILFSGDEGGTA